MKIALESIAKAKSAMESVVYFFFNNLAFALTLQIESQLPTCCGSTVSRLVYCFYGSYGSFSDSNSDSTHSKICLNHEVTKPQNEFEREDGLMVGASSYTKESGKPASQVVINSEGKTNVIEPCVS